MKNIDILTILTSEPRPIKFDGVQYTVREMDWPDLLRLLELAAAKLSTVFTLTPAGKVDYDISKLRSLILESKDLTAFLVAASTDIPADKKISTPAMVQILAVIMELNFNEQVTDALKKLGDRILAVVPVKPKVQSAA